MNLALLLLILTFFLPTAYCISIVGTIDDYTVRAYYVQQRLSR